MVRKVGAGRKVNDSIMESKIIEWVKEFFVSHSRLPENRELKKKALEISQNGNFKASKGWCDKFMRRNKKVLQTYMDQRQLKAKQ